ncbi:HET-domain-containing protein [Hypoxylon sp. EC38]|nr:HET-domain-containing protein [Hypoxylon sp. EC38]
MSAPQDQLCSNCAQNWNTLLSFLQCDPCSRNAQENVQNQICLSARDILDNTNCPLCRLLAACLSPSEPHTIRDHLVLLGRGYHLFGWCRTENDTNITPSAHNHGHHAHSVTVTLQNSCSITGHGDGSALAELKILEESGGDNLYNIENLFRDSSNTCQPRGRRVPSLVNIQLVRNWLRHCENNHSQCIAASESSKPEDNRNIRLIDVKDQCIVHMPRSSRYISLSYVWGHVPNDILTNETENSLLSPGSLTEKNIPRTIYDAMLFTADIGERYLWVDSACILQDNASDKQRHLPTMAEIYAHAILVICAASGVNANDSIPGVRDTAQRAFQRVESINGVSLVNVQTGLREALGRTVWSSRGWTFQEAIVPTRVLIFMNHQVHWICLEESWCEDSLKELTYHGVRSAGRTFSFWNDRKVYPCFENCSPLNAERVFHCASAAYCQKVMEFSKRKFTNESDIFWAFTGVFYRIKDDFPRGFIWAIPLDFLDVALLWRKRCLHHSHYRSAKYVPPQGSLLKIPEEFMKSPSWSWLSVSCGVFYETTCEDDLISEVEWHMPIYYELNAKFFDLYPHTAISPDSKPTTSMIAEKKTEQGSSTSDFALLDLTGQIATLELRVVDKTRLEDPKTPLIHAQVCLPTGSVIGSTWAEPGLFSPSWTFQGEFLLLSSHKRPKQDDCFADEPNSQPCVHRASLNVMVILRTESGLTTRISLVRLCPEVWEQAQAKKERIILA